MEKQTNPMDELQRACYSMLGCLNNKEEKPLEDFSNEFAQEVRSLATALSVFIARPQNPPKVD